ncbi:palmitoyl-protein thioesterase [Armillaria solidipes]|uniref:Palmitoyl-protein thioesterase 1 n=1 Tax=Armillaria solidipes TaxID=1076256 RepID=A0A2H3BKM8_9AGAR|nr:palmitoyl-protein thioesterase [Armillaria solidipes]
MKLPLLAVPLLSALHYTPETTHGSPRPLVLWHGLGDSYSSPGMTQFASLIEDIHPGIFVHSIYIDEVQDNDRKAGFYGNVNAQIEFVSDQLRGIPELAGGFDAIGFSQGGQFLRAYVEQYNDPPVNNLITFGAQHMGISDIPICSAWDLLCQVARRATKSAVYSTWAQENLVQAQYFRDPNNLPTYLSANHFLTAINNELPPDVQPRNQTYAHNLASLNSLVLVMFLQDKTVVPKESSWFASEAPPDDMVPGQDVLSDKNIIPMKLQPLYREDWIGLRTLDEQGGVVFATCDGEHMQVDRPCWEPLVKEFVGELID